MKSAYHEFKNVFCVKDKAVKESKRIQKTADRTPKTMNLPRKAHIASLELF